MKKGYTLIELIIAITLFAIVSGIGVNIIYNVFYGYSDTKIKNFLYNEVKFTFERIDKEMHNTISNSIRADNELLQYLLFSKSFYYEKNDNKSIIVYDNLTGLNLKNKKIAIYILSYSDVFNSNTLLQKIYTIENYIKNSTNKWTLILNKPIISDSPYHRCYLIDKPVTIFKNDDKLIRCFGYTINASDGKNQGTCNVLTNYVDSVQFQFLPGTIKKDGILKIYLSLERKDILLKYRHEVHFRNVP